MSGMQISGKMDTLSCDLSIYLVSIDGCTTKFISLFQSQLPSNLC